MGDVSGGNCSMNNHSLSQHDFDSNNGDVSSRNSLMKSHTIFQYDDSITFKYMQ